MEDLSTALTFRSSKLVPRSERKVNTKHVKRIEASLRAVGLIDPLVVFPQGDSYEILDGCLRYRILLEMGVENGSLFDRRIARSLHRQPNGEPAQRIPRDAHASQVPRGTRREDDRRRLWDDEDQSSAQRGTAQEARSYDRQGVRKWQDQLAVREGTGPRQIRPGKPRSSG